MRAFIAIAIGTLFVPVIFGLMFLLNILAAHGHAGIGVMLIIAYPIVSAFGMAFTLSGLKPFADKVKQA